MKKPPLPAATGVCRFKLAFCQSITAQGDPAEADETHYAVAGCKEAERLVVVAVLLPKRLRQPTRLLESPRRSSFPESGKD